MSSGTFQKRTLMAASAAKLFEWHARSGAIERLSPPWDPLQVLSSRGGIQTGAEVLLRMKAGPVSFRWQARHTDFEMGKLFRDVQTRGPFAAWEHTHRFEPEGPTRCWLQDTVVYRLPLHAFSGVLFNRFIERKLRRIFTYRHAVTASDLQFHTDTVGYRPLHVLLSGASGLVGASLIPFLTTGGHRVSRLVRRAPDPQKGEYYWNPETGIIDLKGIDPIDAVIHLAGDNIGQGRWTGAKKARIIDSRVKGTTLLARTIAALPNPPTVFVSASAIGYYGDRGDQWLTETDTAGRDFISEVCQHWEEAARPAINQGIRTAFLRIGIVLDPRGGALARLLLPFSLGLGGRLGSGRQYLSWIALDDVLGAIYPVIFDPALQGPVNVVAPSAVTNAEFTRTLAAVLSRPAWMALPAALIQGLFGQQGREILLSSTRVAPSKLQERAYPFRFKGLEALLRHVLGR